MPPRYTNCPNCGAPLPESGTCEYCGSLVVMTLEDFIRPIKVEMEGERTVRWYNPKTRTWEWVTPK